METTTCTENSNQTRLSICPGPTEHGTVFQGDESFKWYTDNIYDDDPLCLHQKAISLIVLG